jgi:CO dehydrogenase maturation factor
MRRKRPGGDGLSFSIAVAGKGGSGKTTLSGLIIHYLQKNKQLPILAVDADPNANLGESLGLEVKDTVGAMLDRFQQEKNEIPPGMTKESYLELKLNGILVESRQLDLLTMGKTEGQGCYCYPNSVLREFIDRLAHNYAFIVMDNEAGMEHLSRGTTQDIDELMMVSNHSVKGVRTLARIKELVSELKLRIKHQSVVINMVPKQLDVMVANELEKLGLKPDVIIPLDEQVNEYDLTMKPLLDLPDESPAALAISRFFATVLSKKLEV